MYYHTNLAREFLAEGLTGNIKSVLYSLCSRADENHWCNPGYGTIAKDAAVSIATAKRAVAFLEKHEVLIVRRIKRPGGQENFANEYYVFSNEAPAYLAELEKRKLQRQGVSP